MRSQTNCIVISSLTESFRHAQDGFWKADGPKFGKTKLPIAKDFSDLPILATDCYAERKGHYALRDSSMPKSTKCRLNLSVNLFSHSKKKKMLQDRRTLRNGHSGKTPLLPFQHLLFSK